MARRRRLAGFALIALPIFFLAGLHGFTSVNVLRYNVPVVLIWSLAVTLFAIEMANRLAASGRLPLPLATVLARYGPCP